jgi:hypothetical protein
VGGVGLHTLHSNSQLPIQQWVISVQNAVQTGHPPPFTSPLNCHWKLPTFEPCPSVEVIS